MSKRAKIILLLLICLTSAIDALADWTMSQQCPVADVFALTYNSSVKRLFGAFNPQGFAMSSTQSDTWVTINSNISLKSEDIVSIDNKILAATDSGVYVSPAGSIKWTNASNGLGSWVVSRLYASGTMVFAITDEPGIYFSKDNGANWTNIIDPIIQDQPISISVSGNMLYIGTTFGHIYSTSDTGTTWKEVNSNTPADIKALIADGNNIIIGTTSGIMISSNGGTNWSPANTGLKNTSINYILMNGSKLFAATNDGIYFSDKGGKTWIGINEGLSNTKIYSLAMDDKYLYAGPASSAVYKRPLSEIVFPEVTAPTLLAPEDSATGLASSVVFTWNEVPGAVTYHFQLSQTNDFSNVKVNKDGLDKGLQQVNDLDLGTTYYWRVATNTADFQTLWSKTFVFKTKPVDVPVFPAKLVFPANDSTKETDFPFTFRWNAASGAESYGISVSLDTEGVMLIINEDGITDTSFTIPKDVDKMLEHKVHFWRVTSYGNNNKVAVSEVHMFKTGQKIIEGIQESEDLTLGVEAYPNPAGNSLTVNITLKKPGNIELFITDITGKIVSNIFTGYQESGSFTLNSNIASLPQGTYNLVLKMGNSNISQKIVIAR